MGISTRKKIRLKHENGHTSTLDTRLKIRKTYKLYIDGKFPRTESGRYYSLIARLTGESIHVCRASRKDVRDCIVSNRKAWPGWHSRSAFNRGQILYRTAEVLESRREQFAATLELQGISRKSAVAEVSESIDLLVYYAGWCDKYQQVFSSVNPVESSHFNFSFPEPTGVVFLVAGHKRPLLGLVELFAPVITGANTCTLLADQEFPLTAVELAEVLHASDIPGGVLNILTGFRKELIHVAAGHMDVNAFAFIDFDASEKKSLDELSSMNVKRVVDFSKEPPASPYRIMSCQEIKTTWHPIGY